MYICYKYTDEINRDSHVCIATPPTSLSVFSTRIEFFRKNYREIHGNQGIPKFLGIFTVFTVIFTGNHGNFYRNSW